MIAIVGLLGFAALFARAVQLQTLDADWLAKRAEQQAATTVSLEALRGPLVDRRGTVLAVSASVESVAGWPKQIGRTGAPPRALSSVR